MEEKKTSQEIHSNHFRSAQCINPNGNSSVELQNKSKQRLENTNAIQNTPPIKHTKQVPHQERVSAPSRFPLRPPGGGDVQGEGEGAWAASGEEVPLGGGGEAAVLLLRALRSQGPRPRPLCRAQPLHLPGGGPRRRPAQTGEEGGGGRVRGGQETGGGEQYLTTHMHTNHFSVPRV